MGRSFSPDLREASPGTETWAAGGKEAVALVGSGWGGCAGRDGAVTLLGEGWS